MTTAQELGPSGAGAGAGAGPLLTLHRNVVANHRGRLGQARQEVVRGQLADFGSRLLAPPRHGARFALYYVASYPWGYN